MVSRRRCSSHLLQGQVVTGLSDQGLAVLWLMQEDFYTVHLAGSSQHPSQGGRY